MLALCLQPPQLQTFGRMPRPMLWPHIMLRQGPHAFSQTGPTFHTAAESERLAARSHLKYTAAK